MVQCKIFKFCDTGTLEGQINSWLSDINCFTKIRRKGYVIIYSFSVNRFYGGIVCSFCQENLFFAEESFFSCVGAVILMGV